MKECENIRKRKIVSLQMIKEMYPLSKNKRASKACCFYSLVFLFSYDTIQVPMNSSVSRVAKINFSLPVHVQTSACGDICRL